MTTTKRDVVALYLAARDPRAPWYAKVVAACMARDTKRRVEHASGDRDAGPFQE